MNSTVVQALEDCSTTPTVTTTSFDDNDFHRSNSKDDDGRSDDVVATIADYFGGNDGNGRGGDNNNNAACDNHRGGRKRGNMQLVAGSGKTYIAWKVMERLLLPEEDPGYSKNDPPKQLKLGLYVTPYLNLIDQALNNREEHGIMMGAPIGGSNVETMIVASRSSRSSRKQEQCTTDVDAIVSF